MTRGRYSTKQKDVILNVISEIGRDFSIKDIFDKVSDSTSLTTIYRLIEQLEDEGVVEKIGNNYQYIEKCGCNHFYLKCEKCGRLIHVECKFVEELQHHIEKDHKFLLNKDRIIINGICKNCLEEK